MDTGKLPEFAGIWKLFTKALFIVIRSVIWASTFMFCAPEPLGWLRGVVIERRVDWELCNYYFLQDLKQFLYYLIYIFIWSLPFVKIKKMWLTLRIDILSILAAVLINTTLYLLYVQWFS